MEAALARGGRLASLSRGSPAWLVAGAAVGLLVLAPLLSVLSALATGGGEHWSTVAQTVLGRYALNSFLLSAGVLVLATAIGTVAAWFQTLYEYPLRRVFDLLLMLPLAMPAYVVAFIYSGMFSYSGVFQRIFRNTLGMEAGSYPTVGIESLPGLIVVLALVLYPYVYVTVRARLSQQSQAPLEAARTLTESGPRIFMAVGLPLLRPAVIAGAALVLMETLNEYGAAVYYGVETLSVGVFRTWFAYNDLQTTRFLASLFLLLVFLLLWGERKVRGRGGRATAGPQRPVSRRVPSRWLRVGIYAVVGLPVALGFVLPSLQLLHWARLSVGQADWVLVARSTMNTVFVAGLGAVLCLLAGIVVAYAPRVAGGRGFRHLTNIAALGHAVPGAVIAIGVMSLLAGLNGAVIGSLGALLFAYTVRFLALAHRPLSEGFTQISGGLDEAGRSLGRGPSRTLASVNLPVMSATMRAAFVIAFVDIVKELPLTTVLRPFDFPTLAVETFRLAGDERLAESSITALVLILVGTVPVVAHRLEASRLRPRNAAAGIFRRGRRSS